MQNNLWRGPLVYVVTKLWIVSVLSSYQS
eukprot:UN22380